MEIIRVGRGEKESGHFWFRVRAREGREKN